MINAILEYIEYTKETVNVLEVIAIGSIQNEIQREK